MHMGLSARTGGLYLEACPEHGNSVYKAEIPTKKMWLSKFIKEIRVEPTKKKC